MIPKELLSIFQDIGINKKTKEGIHRALYGNKFNSLLTIYFEDISYDDAKYKRLMNFLKLFRNPIIKNKNNKNHDDLVDLFLLSIQNGRSLQDIISRFSIILSHSSYIEQPLISLQRRSFTL